MHQYDDCRTYKWENVIKQRNSMKKIVIKSLGVKATVGVFVDGVVVVDVFFSVFV